MPEVISFEEYLEHPLRVLSNAEKEYIRHMLCKDLNPDTAKKLTPLVKQYWEFKLVA